MNVRPMELDRDVDAAVRVLHQADSWPGSAAEWREQERLRAPGTLQRHLVGELDGTIVALGAVQHHEVLDDAVAARIVVDAAHRGRGYGRAMADAVEAIIAARAPAVVEVRVREDDPGSLAWAERRGFTLHAHTVRSRLDLATYDAPAHRPAVERALAAGYRLEATTDASRLHDLYVPLVADTPGDMRAPDRAYLDRQRERRPAPVWLVASRGEDWAGVATITLVEPDGAWNSFTGVLPEHRGHGLATALKVAAIEELVRQGRLWVETSNHVVNAPMLAVNRALGYRAVSGTLFLRRAGSAYAPR